MVDEAVDYGGCDDVVEDLAPPVEGRSRGPANESMNSKPNDDAWPLGVITGPIPEDIGREEPGRITAEAKQARAVLDTAQSIYANVEQPLKAALNLAGRADEIYRIGGPRSGDYPTSTSSQSCSSPKSTGDPKSSKLN